MQPLDGTYSVQLYSRVDRNVTLTSYIFDSAGDLVGSARKALKVKVGSPTLASTVYSSSVDPRQYASLAIAQTIFLDSRYKDMAFISGTITPVDGRPISDIEKSIKVNVGKYSKVIERKNLIKIRTKGQTNYTYLSLVGRTAIVLNINVTTGAFNLFVSNIDLDNGKSEIVTDMSFELDSVYAANLVSFKNIKRKK